MVDRPLPLFIRTSPIRDAGISRTDRSRTAGKAGMPLLQRHPALVPATRAELDRPPQQQCHGHARGDQQHRLANGQGQGEHHRQGDDRPGDHQRETHVDRALERPSEAEEAELELIVHQLPAYPTGQGENASVTVPAVIQEHETGRRLLPLLAVSAALGAAVLTGCGEKAEPAVHPPTTAATTTTPPAAATTPTATKPAPTPTAPVPKTTP